MSNALMQLVWKVDMPTGRKMVLLALADRADRDGECWPSRDLLAEMTGLAPSRVSLHLRDLISSGFLGQARRHRKSAVYTVSLDRLEAAVDVSNGDVDQKVNLSKQDVSKQDVLIQDESLSDQSTSRIERSTPIYQTPKNPQSSETDDDAENPDARKLCERLAELMTGNGCKPPPVSRRWLDAARLLFTKDNRPTAEALAVLDWCQADDFESVNIHSMTKFRTRYDQLRMKAQRAGALTAATKAPRTADAIDEWLRQQWKAGTVDKITAATGLRYQQPDLPLGIDSHAEIAEYFTNHRRDWITEHQPKIVAILTEGEPHD